MPKYNVAITEVLEYLVPIEAENASAAERVAEKAFNDAADRWEKFGVALRLREIEGVNEGWD